MTQDDLAAVLGVTHGYLSNLENNKTGVSETTIKLICLVYHVRRAWLVDGEGPMWEEGYDAAGPLPRGPEPEPDAITREIIRAVAALSDEGRRALAEFLRTFQRGENAPQEEKPPDVGEGFG